MAVLDSMSAKFGLMNQVFFTHAPRKKYLYNFEGPLSLLP